jgi:hypothetical protein
MNVVSKGMAARVMSFGTNSHSEPRWFGLWVTVPSDLCVSSVAETDFNNDPSYNVASSAGRTLRARLNF